MKTSSLRAIIRVVLLLAAAGAVYEVGSLNSPAQNSAKTNKPGIKMPSAGREDAQTAAIEKHEEDEMNREISLTSLLAEDTAKGLAELAKLPPGHDTETMYAHVFGMWASGDSPQDMAAAAAAFALPPGANRDAALQAVLKAWGQTHPKDLLDWASSLAATDSSVLKNALISVIGNPDYTTAPDYTTVPSPSHTLGIFGPMINVQNGPTVAAQYLDKLPDATARNQVIGVLAQTMAEDDPAAALNWLDQVALGNTYVNDVKSLFSNLAQHDPAEAAALTANVTAPDLRHSVITNLASNWAKSDPPAALAWAQTLPDSDAVARAAALNSIVTNWSKTDPTAALDAAQTVNLPEDQRATLVQSITKTQPADQ